MAEFFATVKKRVTDFFAKIDRKQKISMIVLFVLIFAVTLTAALILGHVEYTVLYSGMDAAEAGEVMTLLKSMDVEVKTEGAGTLLVPADRADELRMELAAQGYPKTGLNYGLFANASGFGATDADRRTYYQYQLQENLRTTILKMGKIADCIVMVNMTEESAFVVSENTSEASASVMLELRGSDTLSRGEVKAIRELVATSVPGLSPDRVSIVDANMNLYTPDESESTVYADNQYKLKSEVQNTLAEQVDTLLSPVFGKDNIHTAVNVVLNFDSETVTKMEFSPPVEGETEGLVTSIEEIYEATRDAEADGGAVGTDANGLSTTEYVYGGLDENEYYEKVQRGINYELNETNTMIEKAKGAIEQLSVAVLLDSEVAASDITERVKSLVANAIGVAGDRITVETMPFTGSDSAGEGIFDEYHSLLDAVSSDETVRTLIVAAAAVVVAVLLFLLLKSVFGGQGKRRLAGAYEGQSIDVIVGDEDEEAEEDSPIEIKKDKSGTASQIEKFIEKDSEAVAQLLRNWLTDDSR